MFKFTPAFIFDEHTRMIDGAIKTLLILCNFKIPFKSAIIF